VNRAVGLEAVDQTAQHDHYVQVNVGIGKRVRCAQFFGTSDEITTGSKVPTLSLLFTTLKFFFTDVDNFDTQVYWEQQVRCLQVATKWVQDTRLSIVSSNELCGSSGYGVFWAPLESWGRH